ncbi:hypothetical protein LWI28_003272 [Acer negundo]|uniref:Uncharacterized protein n=1 Tax=Acer negundo TaxID=4023 RepID=A0AAD5IUL0_ACENE|nr:hypothetical protein LWI28_003272 [Acer negundo]
MAEFGKNKDKGISTYVRILKKRPNLEANMKSKIVISSNIRKQSMSSSSNSDVDEGQFLDFKILRGKCSKCKGLDVVACEDRLKSTYTARKRDELSQESRLVKSSSIPWILEVELAKVVEERVSKGYDFIARNAKRTFKEIKDGENMNVSSPSSEWSLEVEIAKVLEVGYALGYDFNGR